MSVKLQNSPLSVFFWQLLLGTRFQFGFSGNQNKLINPSVVLQEGLTGGVPAQGDGVGAGHCDTVRGLDPTGARSWSLYDVFLTHSAPTVRVGLQLIHIPAEEVQKLTKQSDSVIYCHVFTFYF